MSRDWNGLDLQTELSELLGDVSTSFKARVLGWLNDGQNDISGKHRWANLKHKGKKILTVSGEEQSLLLSRSSAPTLASSGSGASLTAASYNVLVTFYEGVSGAESVAGVASNAVAISDDKQLDVTSIPVSSDPLVTARKVYLVSDSGDPFFSQTISDNTTTTATITSDSSSTISAPDYGYIMKLDGDPFFESSSQLSYRTSDQMRLLFQGTWSSGTPSYWNEKGPDRIEMYPTPSTALTLSFNYYKRPGRIFASVDSQPEIIPELKGVLRAYVIARGYEYRDRSGQESKLSNYEQLLADAINKFGHIVINDERVRDTVGSADGYEI